MYVFDVADNRHLFTDFEENLNSALDSVIAAPHVEHLPVDGLAYVADFITHAEEKYLLAAVEGGAWNSIWQRRTQHYGDSYDEWAEEPRLGRSDLPCWVRPFASRVFEQGHFSSLPNQVGVNEYLPGQGIAPHVDRHAGPVASLSLGSGCVMDLVSLFDRPRISFWLAPRSLIVIQGEARSAWKHGIARRQKDIVDGMPYRRRRRVSITFRKIER